LLVLTVQECVKSIPCGARCHNDRGLRGHRKEWTTRHMNEKNSPGLTGDAEIICQVIDGNANAFEHLFRKYMDHVLRIVKKHVPYDQVEETAHDVFIKAYKSLPSLRNRDGFKPWVSSIATRTCHDFWRRAYRSKERTISSLSQGCRDWLETVMSERSAQCFNEKNRLKEAREILDWALAGLSAMDRMVLELVYLEGLTCRETADLMGITVANVKVRSHRSRKKLKKLLSELTYK